MNALQTISSSSTSLTVLLERTAELISNSKSQSTLNAYRSDWADFSAWCDGAGRASMPATPETVALYLTDLTERCKPATIQRRIASISQAHKTAGHETPTQAPQVRAVWQGIRRTLGTAQDAKSPILTENIRGMVDAAPDTLAGVRDRALLLVGFAGAFRRSELVALTVEDLQWTVNGVTITIQQSKTDQEGAGRKVALPYGCNEATCPVRSLQGWLTASGIETGAIYRPINRHGVIADNALTGHAVAEIVKRYALKVGLDPADFSGHSLRAGLATSAAAAGVSERKIMQQTGHKSERMVRKYIREGDLYRDNAAGALGL